MSLLLPVPDAILRALSLKSHSVSLLKTVKLASINTALLNQVKMTTSITTYTFAHVHVLAFDLHVIYLLSDIS